MLLLCALLGQNLRTESEFEFGSHKPSFWRILEVESELSAYLLHPLVFNKDITDQALEFFVLAELDQSPEQFCAKTLALELVGDEHGYFGLICTIEFDEVAYANNLALPCLRVCILADKSHLPVVVNETHADQLFVGDSLAQTQRVQPTEIDTAS